MKKRKLEALAEEAMDAFWNVIVKRFPQAKTGDISPTTMNMLDIAAKGAIREWVSNNVPKAKARE